MSEIRTTCFADSVSSTAIQLRVMPSRSQSPDANPGLEIVQANLVLSATADTTFWQATCTMYDVIIRRRT